MINQQQVIELSIAGITHAKIAERLGVTRGRISQILRDGGWWTVERTQKARELYLAGKTHSEITKEIGAPSRSAVIGKLSRMGVRRSPAENRSLNGGVSRRVVAAKSRKSGRKSEKKDRGFGFVREVDPELVAARTAACSEDGLRRVARVEAETSECAIPLTQRRRFQCSWPIGVPDRPALQMCCGDQVTPDQPGSVETYCPRHAALATSKVKPKDTDALLRLARAA